MSPSEHDTVATRRLIAYRATRPNAQPTDPAFPTQTGGRRDKDNVNRRVIAPAVRAANALRTDRGESPPPAAVTAHTVGRTFIRLMLEAGAPVPYVQAQVGHEDATTTLKICAQILKRRDRTHHGQALHALMSDAVPSAPSIMMLSKVHFRDWEAREIPPVPGGSGHRNDLKRQPVTS